MVGVHVENESARYEISLVRSNHGAVIWMSFWLFAVSHRSVAQDVDVSDFS